MSSVPDALRPYLQPREGWLAAALLLVMLLSLGWSVQSTEWLEQAEFLVPVAFLAMCAFMVWSSFDYVANSPYGPKFGNLVLAGLIVMAVGVPLYFLARRK